MELKYQLAMKIIKHFEGFRATPYICPAGILTIGYGRTGNVKWGDKTTEAAEEAWLLNRMKQENKVINEVVRPYMNPHQMAALISFCYNVGQGAFRRSTLVKRLNNNDRYAHEEFARWVKAGNTTLPGLVRRRRAETRVFLGEAL